jgi:hypothetical protein
MKALCKSSSIHSHGHRSFQTTAPVDFRNSAAVFLQTFILTTSNIFFCSFPIFFLTPGIFSSIWKPHPGDVLWYRILDPIREWR